MKKFMKRTKREKMYTRYVKTIFWLGMLHFFWTMKKAWVIIITN